MTKSDFIDIVLKDVSRKDVLVAKVTENDVRILSHEVNVELGGKAGHKFRIALKRQGGNCFVGMTVVGHIHPNGRVCAHDTSHLFGVHKNFELTLMDVIERHCDACGTKWWKNKLQIIR